METKPTISIKPDTRVMRKKGYPVTLRAKWPRPGSAPLVIRYALGFYCLSEDDFNKADSNAPVRETRLKDLRAELIKVRERVKEILDAHVIIDPDDFQRMFTQEGNFKDVKSVFNLKIAELEKRDRVGSIGLYKAICSILMRFRPGVTFIEINKDFLYAFESWLLKPHEEEIKSPTTGKVVRTVEKTCERSTVGIYMRHIRAIFNLAIDLKYVHKDFYPFGRNKYKIPKGRKRKIALTIAQKDELVKLTPEDFDTAYALDFWKFSYYCSGLNPTDICNLRFKHIRNDLITIPRAKTIESDLEPLRIPLLAPAKKIIASRGNKSLNPNDFVFPVFIEGLSAKEQKQRVKAFTKKINKGLRRVAVLMGLDERITSYTARHTFAAVSLQKGQSLEYIQKALGHNSILTTETYCGDFDEETKRANAGYL